MYYLQDIYFSNINVVYNLGGYFSLPKNGDWSCDDEPFEQNKFYYITDGSCTINIDGKSYIGKAGDWFFIPANTVHSFFNHKEKPFRKYWMHFDIYPNASIFHLLNLPYVISVNTTGTVKNLFNKFSKLIGGDEWTDKLKIKSIIFNLLVEYIKNAKPCGIKLIQKTDERLNDLLRFINENLDKELTIKVLAEKYFSHPTHFIRSFKDKTGLTPKKYIKVKRIENAKLLLEKTDLPIWEITQAIGLKDETHFYRCFKEIYNMAPTKYRNYFKNQLII